MISFTLYKFNMLYFYYYPDLVSQASYDPLLLLATELTYKDNSVSSRRKLKLAATTICPAIPSLPSLLAIILFPIVQLVIDEADSIVGVMIFAKRPNGTARLEGCLRLTVALDKEDEALIETIRRDINIYFLHKHWIDYAPCRNNILTFICKQRPRLNMMTWPDIRHLPETIPCNIHIYMEAKPKYIKVRSIYNNSLK
jgi:hypothetical protein